MAKTSHETRESFTALTMGIASEIFALDANIVREILDIIPVTQVPGARDFVPGLINVRGRVVPLADLRVKFGMEQATKTEDSRIVVVEIDMDGEPTIVGLMADRVYEVTEISGVSIAETPETGMSWRADYVKGIGKRGDEFIIIPDIERIFTAD